MPKKNWLEKTRPLLKGTGGETTQKGIRRQKKRGEPEGEGYGQQYGTEGNVGCKKTTDEEEGVRTRKGGGRFK